MRNGYGSHNIRCGQWFAQIDRMANLCSVCGPACIHAARSAYISHNVTRKLPASIFSYDNFRAICKYAHNAAIDAKDRLPYSRWIHFIMNAPLRPLHVYALGIIFALLLFMMDVASI